MNDDNKSKTESKVSFLQKEKELDYHTAIVSDILCIPFSDGIKRLISCSDDKTIKIFNCSSGKEEDTITHDTLVYCLRYNKAKNQLLFTDFYGVLQIFDFKEDKFVFHSRAKLCDKWIQSFMIHGEDDVIAVVQQGGQVLYVPNVNEFKDKKVLYTHKKGLYSNILRLKKDKDTVFVGGWKPNILAKISLKDFKAKPELFKEVHEDHIRAITSYIAVKEDEERIVASAYDKVISFWRPNGELIKKVKHDEIIYSTYGVSKGLILLGGYWGVIYSLNTINYVIRKEVEYHSARIHSFAFISFENDDDYRFASCSTDKKIALMKIKGNRIKEFENENFDSNERRNHVLQRQDWYTFAVLMKASRKLKCHKLFLVE